MTLHASTCSTIDERLVAHCPHFGIAVPLGTRQGRVRAEDLGLVAICSSRWCAAATGSAHPVPLDTSRRTSFLAIPYSMVCSAFLPLTLTLIAAWCSFLLGEPTGGVTLVVTLVTLLFFNVAHEFGHFAALWLVESTSQHAHFISRLGFGHLIRPVLRGWREAAVVIAGPATAAAFASLLSIGFSTQSHTKVVSFLLIAIGVGHLSTLALPHGDGANLRTALHRRAAD